MKRLGIVTLRLLQILVVYMSVRGLFYIWNFSDLSTATVPDLGHAFLLGLRFDVSAILAVNGLFFLFWLWPWQGSGRHLKIEQASVVLYFLVNLFFLSMNVADVELSKFNGRRMTPQYFFMAQDVSAQFIQLCLNYWKLSLVVILLFALMVWTFPRQRLAHLSAEHVSSPSGWRRFLAIGLIVLALPLVVLGIRGGFQDKPLREAHAYVFKTPALGNLVLNTPFVFVHAKSGQKATEEVRWLPPARMQAWEKENRFRTSSANGALRGRNVVLIILESFSLEYMGKVNGRPGYTPFLDSLGEKGLFFRNAFANGRRSIEAVPAILSSLPSLYAEPFLLSGRQSMTLPGLPHDLKENGFQTMFFHGAKNGSMFFDSFSFRVGVDHYYGLSQYPSPDADYDGFWGVLDEPFLQYFKSTLDQAKAPFFASVFTLSSHQPYPVPEHLRSQFPKGTLEIHPSIAYADYSLRRFFEAAEVSPWFQNTLFIITADHTQKSDDPAYADDLGPYRVPLILYAPGADWPAIDLQQVVKHADIYPTVVDLLGVPAATPDNSGLSVIPTGRSIFDGNRGYVVNRTAEGFWYLDDQYFLKRSAGQDFSFRHQNFKDLAPIELNVAEDPAWLRFLGYAQYVLNGLQSESQN